MQGAVPWQNSPAPASVLLEISSMQNCPEQQKCELKLYFFFFNLDFALKWVN